MDRMGLVRQSRRGKNDVVPSGDAKLLKPSELASLSKAWNELEERKRILRMKPMPKPVDVNAQEERRLRRRAPAQLFRE